MLDESAHPVGESPKDRGAVTHELKCWAKFFGAIERGEKKHDLRRSNDRDFQIGDRLRLREFNPESDLYTGRVQYVTVTYITSADMPCALSKQALNPEF